MATTIRYHLDENVNHAIAHGLRLRGIDVTTATDAELLRATDEEHLAFAARTGRVLVTMMITCGSTIRDINTQESPMLIHGRARSARSF